MADNRFNKSLEEHFINNDTQYNFGGWTPQISLGMDTIYIAYGSGNPYKKLSYSYDGFNWFSGTTDFPNTGATSAFQECVWINDRFWTTSGQLGTSSVYYSYDGFDWEQVPLPYFSTGLPGRMDWDGTKFIIVGAVNNLTSPSIYSYDGLSWSGLSIISGMSISQTYQINEINYGGGLWHAAPGQAPYNPLKYSNDGFTWTNCNFPFSSGTDTILGIEYGNGKWVAVFVGTSVPFFWYSTDGINFSSGSTSSTGIYQMYSVVYGNGIWVATGRVQPNLTNDVIQYSTNGINWSPCSNISSLYDNASTQFYAVMFDGEKFLVGNYQSGNYLISYSYDGNVWNAADDGFTRNYSSITKKL